MLFPFFEAWFHSSKVVYVEKRFASLQHQQLLRGYSSRADFTNLGSGSGGGGGAGDEGTAKAASMPSSTGLATGLVVGNAAGLMSLNNMSDRWSPPLSVSDAESDAFGTPDVSENTQRFKVPYRHAHALEAAVLLCSVLYPRAPPLICLNAVNAHDVCKRICCT